jgi:glycosyltransferase involved in cell wall biosynthesis
MKNAYIILPCFNEQEALPAFWNDLKSELSKPQFQGFKFKTVWIDDGSSDQTWKVIETLTPASNLHHHGIRFSRNFGHQAAIQAGCDYVSKLPEFTKDSLVIIMDSDGQHPIECLEMILKSLNTHRHVQMIRKETESAGMFKKFSSNLFYQLFRFFTDVDMPNGAADFRGLHGSTLLNYLKFTESGRFNRGLFHLTEPPYYIPYSAKERKHGVSKYNISKMLKLAFVGITNFSNRPLILASFSATAFGFIVCIGYFFYELICLYHGRVFQPGWFTIMAWISMWGMILSFCMFILSIYLGRVFDEAKKRPIYLVGDILFRKDHS